MNRIVPLLFLLVLCCPGSFLIADDEPLMGVDPDWLPEAGEEYFALNFAAYLTYETQIEILEGQSELPDFFDEERFSLDYRSSFFQLFIDGSILNDGLYSAQEPYLGGRYIDLNDAYLETEFSRLNIKAGSGLLEDVVDTPYSLFISSNDVTSPYAEINYLGDFFFYKTRWVSLNYNSACTYYGTDSLDGVVDSYWPDDETAESDTSWLDKGMNFKVYGLDFGDWRIGLEDVTVYLGSNFDAEYFLSPMPGYFTQLINTEEGFPWQQAGNSKSMMGFFTDLEKDDYGGNAQILIDDINLDFLPFIDDLTFKTRMAWSFSGWKSFDFGTFGFYHGGATKYSFSSTRTIESSDSWGSSGYVDVPYSILPYDYTYYPSPEYELEDGTVMPVYYEDIYVGYKYGENNIAFLFDYENVFFRNEPWEFKLYSSLEYIVNGAKSPSNPWHEYDSTRNENIEDYSFVLLNDDTLEHVLKVSGNARKRMGDFTFMLELVLGYVFNGIELVSVTPDYEDYDTIYWDEPKIYVPQEGNNYPLVQITAGVNYSLEF